jgi:hypothetical protein
MGAKCNYPNFLCNEKRFTYLKKKNSKEIGSYLFDNHNLKFIYLMVYIKLMSGFKKKN